MVAPLIILPFIKPYVAFPYTLFIIVSWATVVWLAVTYLTPPTEEKTLRAFYERIHPGGYLWKPIADQLPHVLSDSGYLNLFIDWLAGIILVLFTLFGVGHVILGETGLGLLYLGIAALAAGVIYWHLSRIGWDQVGD